VVRLGHHPSTPGGFPLGSLSLQYSPRPNTSCLHSARAIDGETHTRSTIDMIRHTGRQCALIVCSLPSQVCTRSLLLLLPAAGPVARQRETTIFSSNH
jgi:hypothetical protein